MNADVLKSLGYLKKSLRMSRKSIDNAIVRANSNTNLNSSDVSDKVELTSFEEKITELMEMIVVAENTVSSIPSIPIASASVPAPAIVSNGVDFLDP